MPQCLPRLPGTGRGACGLDLSHHPVLLPPAARCPLPACSALPGQAPEPTLHCNRCLRPPGRCLLPTFHRATTGTGAPSSTGALGPPVSGIGKRFSKAHALLSPPPGLRAHQPHNPLESWRRWMGFLQRCPPPQRVLFAVISHLGAAREREREEDTGNA